jgi:hypothetical protein
MPSVMICLGFRNWHLDHLERCLDTLQRGPWPVSLIDLGSAPGVLEHVDRIAQAHACVVSFCLMPQPEWSRSVALNEAARLLGGGPGAETLVFTDADMLFPESWFEILATMLDAEGGRETLWLTDSRDLPRASARWPAGWWRSEPWLLASTVEHDRVGQGAAMVVPRAWFDRVGGFDEAYRVWGCEDNDLVLRAQWDGQPVDWLPGAWVAHQYHDRTWPTPEQLQQVARNRTYLAARIAERGPVIRAPRGPVYDYALPLEER